MRFNKPPHGFDVEGYRSDCWFVVTLRRFILAARAEQLELWLNDGFDSPPGYAGGRILRRYSGPETSSAAVVWSGSALMNMSALLCPRTVKLTSTDGSPATSARKNRQSRPY